jgi:pimeloyl-ACP methyl ester carboxylesterase/DNA-binding CsgD family transcriptional regulator
VNAPPIQYARTTDGVSIAYSTVGGGKALVYMPSVPFRHMSLLWTISPEDRQQAELFVSAGRRWVMFDPRGMGSSSSVDSFSLEGLVTDLEAVVDKLGLEQFDLAATTTASPIAVEYAVRHPDRVSHLILVYPFLRAADALDTPQHSAIRALHGQDWSLYTDTTMHIVYGGLNPEIGEIISQVLRAAITPERAWQVFRLIDQFDMTEQAQRVEVPTLVIARRGQSVAIEDSRAVAAAIPSAQFVFVESIDHSVPALARFLGLVFGQAATPASATGAAATLTRRELEILAPLVAGRSNREIAGLLVLSERTVARHIANIYEKTGSHGRAEITAYALRHGLA